MQLLLKRLTAMKTNNNPIIESFIIEETLIIPIDKIVIGLKASTYRDCDIKWLDAKLEKYISFAAETLGFKNVIKPSDLNKTSFTVLNDHNTKYYIDKFTTLLEYYKTFLTN